LQSALNSLKSKEAPLKGSVSGVNSRIAGFQGSIDDLQTRLNGIEASLSVQQTLLNGLQAELINARALLSQENIALRQDRKVLADELVAQYESDPPDMVTVVLESDGFADLLERIDDIKRVQGQDTQTVAHVKTAQASAAAQAAHVTGLESRQQEVTGSILAQRDQVDGLKIALLRKQAPFLHRRDALAARLAPLEAQSRGLERRLAAIQQAQAQASGGAVAPASVGSFVPHGGSWGFFPAPGTNYSVGVEPELAARLDVLGKALHLYLVGISGYRTPQHSIEVGGFANDPHTRGDASDTPGVEGVPESTLERFGLTRPFPGAHEADHIQLLGGPS
jgi:peptidoglycan hydrolase CwlO-like protein